MKSRVHPKYKTKYHVGNWPAYDRALVQRGDITVWLAPDAIAAWEAVGVGTRGGQRQYSDLAIETALTLRLIFHLPLRQTEGFLTSIFRMLGLELSVPDHTTLSRRGQHLDLPLRCAPAGAGLHLLVDSTGLSIVGEGEWAAVKHGGRGRRGWKKLHLGVDRSGVIVARALTAASVDDATTGITLIEAVDGALGRVTADAAYDTVGFYEAAGARGATVVVPPTSTANVSRRGPRSRARDHTILAVKEIGRRRWKQMSGYHGQARVENAFFRYKSIIGAGLRACSPGGRGTEVVLACNILNQPGFPFCLPRMAPYTPEGPPSARNSCRRTFVQLQRPSPQPALTCDRLAPLLSGHFSDTAPHVCRFFARRASLHSARASACRRR